MTPTVSSARLDDYRQVAPRGAVDLLLRLSERLKGRRLVNVSGSRYRGLTSEVLNRLVPILNDLGIDASWEVTIGNSDFEGITRIVGRALTGSTRGAVVPVVLWLIVILVPTLYNRPEGDIFVLAEHGQQYAYYGLLFAGAIAGFATIVVLGSPRR